MAGKMTAEFMIVNRRSKKALQATGLGNGPVVEQAASNGSDAQLWTAVPAGDCVKLVNKMSGNVLDVMAEGTVNGTWLQTWEDVGGESQLWKIVKLTATYNKIVNVRSGRVLDIVDMSEDDGAPAQIWDDMDGVGQQWKLVPPENAAGKAGKKAPVKKAAAKKPAAKVEKAPAAKAPAKRGRPAKAASKKAAEAVKALKEEPEKAITKVEEKAKALAKPEEKAPNGKTAAKKAAPKTKK